jgi:Tol biopolymer transport system component
MADDWDSIALGMLEKLLFFLAHRRFILILVVLMSLGLVVWLYLAAGMPKPILKTSEDGQMGAYGPIILLFRSPVVASRVEDYLNLEPAVQGKWTWNGNQVLFRPETAFQIGTTYTLKLLKGASDETGRSLKADMTWSVSIRAPEIVYLGQTASMPEVWVADGSNNTQRQLTDTGGNVQDFAIYPNGDHVVYSVTNTRGGVDLWAVDRSGENQTKLLDCGNDSCLQPSVAPDETAIVFSRKSQTFPQGEIWLLDLTTAKADALYKDQQISGIDPNWSPHGSFLQFYDPDFAQIRVLDLLSNRVILIPTGQQAIGSWSPDGQTLLFTRAESSEIGLPYVRIYEANLVTGEIRPMQGMDLGQVDASLPVYSPDGQTLVMAVRGLAGSPNKQLWLIPLDGRPNQAITDDPGASFAAYRWDPNGNQLVFQRLQLQSSQSRPQVMTWLRESGEFKIVAEDAARPQWLP